MYSALSTTMRSFRRSGGRTFHIAGQFQVGFEQEQIWLAFAKAFWRFHRANQVELHAFVLMTNHYHCLIKFNEESFEFKQILSEIEEGVEVENFFDETRVEREIESFKDYRSVYRYIYRNPLEAHLCSHVERYPWSTLGMIIGAVPRVYPVVDTMEVIHYPQRLEWLNLGA